MQNTRLQPRMVSRVHHFPQDAINRSGLAHWLVLRRVMLQCSAASLCVLLPANLALATTCSQQKQALEL